MSASEEGGDELRSTEARVDAFRGYIIFKATPMIRIPQSEDVTLASIFCLARNSVYILNGKQVAMLNVRS